MDTAELNDASEKLLEYMKSIFGKYYTCIQNLPMLLF
jgi:hypothetical protein